MKNLTILFLFLIASCSIFSISRKPQNFYKSLAMVRIIDQSQNVVGDASAFYIGNDLLLTANHVCNMLEDTRFKHDMQYFHEKFITTDDIQIIKRDAINDICMIKAQGLKMLQFEIAKEDSFIGDFVYSYGCSDGLFGFLSEGFVLDNTLDMGTRKVLTISAPGFFGQSGGPILNEDGLVIGLVSAGNNVFHHIQISPQTKTIRDFIKGYAEQ